MNGHVLALWFTLITLFWRYDQVIGKKRPMDDPDLNKNTSELIISKGYPVEEYSVVTEDGYILSVQRIPPRNPTKDTKVVMLQHGLMGASDCWVFNFPNQSLGFILSDAGYDVWLGNFRGNTYSRKHKSLQPTEKEFWDFSWDEMAFNDLPTMINFILKVTGKQKIHYVGHSMGTSTIFALLSTYTQYNEKIESVMALAPVGNLTHIKDNIFTQILLYARKIIYIFHIYEFAPRNNFLVKFISDICKVDYLSFFCDVLTNEVYKSKPEQMNKTRFPVYLHHYPSGSSWKPIFQYIQNYEAKQFQRYDYGREKNLQRYGQPMAPEFQIERITAPVALFWSQSDLYVPYQNVHDLKARMPNIIDLYEIPIPEWTHMDYIIAASAKKYLHDHLLMLLSKMKNKLLQ